MIIKKGRLVELTTGEYSDYQRHAWVRAKRRFDTDALVKDYLAAHPDQSKPYHASIPKFIAWLLSIEYLEEVLDPCDEWYLGSYGTLYIAGDPAKEIKAGDFFK